MTKKKTKRPRKKLIFQKSFFAVVSYDGGLNKVEHHKQTEVNSESTTNRKRRKKMERGNKRRKEFVWFSVSV
jgi:hypothetical protein